VIVVVVVSAGGVSELGGVGEELGAGLAVFLSRVLAGLAEVALQKIIQNLRTGLLKSENIVLIFYILFH
jgi:hypothetical protein